MSICIICAAPGLLAPGRIEGATASVNNTLSAQISAIGKLSVPANVVLVTPGTTFLAYSASLTVSYRVRTTPGGSGKITMQAADFSPVGGPSISAGDLTYTCSPPTLGAACSGTITAQTSQTTVATFPGSACTGGGGSCSNADPNTFQLNFTLANSPTFKTGTYSAGLTFSISAI